MVLAPSTALQYSPKSMSSLPKQATEGKEATRDKNWIDEQPALNRNLKSTESDIR